MTLGGLKDALNNLCIPEDSEVLLCLPDAGITAEPYFVDHERCADHVFVVRIYGEEPEEQQG